MSTGLALRLTDKQALAYLCRSSGFVVLVLLTATMVLGLLTAGRLNSPRWSRLVVLSLHRNLSLISVALLFVHLLAPVIGGHLGLKLAYAFVPFVTAHIQVWTRAASSATDLILLITIVSLARVKAGYRFWRWVHMTSYVAWSLAVVHATGIGSDRRPVLMCDAVCIAAVALASGYRLRVRWTTAQRYP
jgi:sulfoxide reductase heme-binding subunit YedZ